ncbi:MAG TPA: MFS transporter [Solirubrobacteraceae bacterium]|nr:MFS transporter [Solirubrobacteraceae bacterium]
MSAVVRTDRLSYRDALVSREFRVLLATQLLETGGLSVAAVALTVLVYRRTGSPLLASLTFALGFLPYVLGGSLFSGLVDRVRPRTLAASCDAVSALVVATMALPGLPLPLLFALLLATGTLASISSGARGALTRGTLSAAGYVPGRSLLRISSQLSQIIGNAAGGALLLLVGTHGALLVNAGALALASLTLRLGIGEHPITGVRGVHTLLRDSLRGARAVLALPDLRRLLLGGWFVPLFSVAPEALAAAYVAEHHASSAVVGWWLVALPVGIISGDLLAVRLLSPRGQRRLMAPVAAAGFVPYLAFAANPPIAVAIALLVLSGTSSMYALGIDARVREASPPQLFARVMAVNSSGLMALQGIGFALAGAMGQAIGPGWAVALAGVGGIASAPLLRS